MIGSAEFRWGTRNWNAHRSVGFHRAPHYPPTLFLIYIDDLISQLLTNVVKCQAYADDILTWICRNFRQGVPALELTLVLATVDDWAWR